MRLSCRVIIVSFAVGMAALATPSLALCQESGPAPEAVALQQLPDAPAAQMDVTAMASESGQQAPTTPQGSSSSQAGAPQTDTEKSAHEKAEEQLKQQEKQRVMGVMATFNTTRDPNALPLSSDQKFKLFFRSETDPWPFMLSAVVAGIGQADNSYPEWGQGVQGYAKRFGGAYTDAFIGNFFGNAVLTSLWHEDPRYFQKGKGSTISRILWAASSTVWCKRDKGTWGPNYANVVGNLIGSAIARSYYPASERTVGDTISDGLTVSAEGIVGSEVIEFWPDLVRHHKKKQAEKLAREQAQRDAQDAARQAAKPATPAEPTKPQN